MQIFKLLNKKESFACISIFIMLFIFSITGNIAIGDEAQGEEVIPRCGLPGCDVKVCVSIPADAIIYEVQSYFADSAQAKNYQRLESDDHPNQVIGWCQWVGSYTVSTEGNFKKICRVARNWKHDRDRAAKLVVIYGYSSIAH